jgi:hypothetical protein
MTRNDKRTWGDHGAADNIRRGPGKVTAIDLTLVTETTEVLRARGEYDEVAFHDYIADARTCIAP